MTVNARPTPREEREGPPARRFVRCQDCPLRAQQMFRPFSDGELEFVSGLKSDQLTFDPRQPILHAGGNGEQAYTLLEGWAFRHRTLPDGRRQILDFLLPGDLMGLQTPLLGELSHGVQALTAVVVCAHAGAPFATMGAIQPALSAALMQTLVLEEARADRRQVLLGRQRPVERLAYLMLELHDRLAQRGQAAGGACDFPLTYEHLADALGLSRAQLARSLAEVRARGWADVRGGRLRLLAPDAMAAFAAYEPPSRVLRALL